MQHLLRQRYPSAVSTRGSRAFCVQRVVAVAILGLATTACTRPDPIASDRIVERDQLVREVKGLHTLENVEPGKLMDREHEVLVSLSDTLLRSLINAAFPVDVNIRNRLTVRITGASVTFRSNVARIDLVGQVSRAAFPRVQATLTLRGALDGFAVDSTHALRARMSIDEVSLGTPRGSPAAFDPLVVNVLQNIVERSLPELSAGLPTVTVPVRLAQNMTLPGFGPEGAFTVEPSEAPMNVRASRVIAFQNRLWIILRVELGDFATVARASAAAVPAR